MTRDPFHIELEQLRKRNKELTKSLEMSKEPNLNYLVQQWVIYQKQLVEDLERLYTMATLILTVQSVLLFSLALSWYLGW